MIKGCVYKGSYIVKIIIKGSYIVKRVTNGNANDIHLISLCDSDMIWLIVMDYLCHI